MSAQTGAYTVALSKAAGAGGVLSVANPEGVGLIVKRVIIHKTGGAGGAITADVGIAANGTTSSDTLMDAASLVSAGLIDNEDDKGTNGKGRQLWGATEYLTASASADPSATSLAGYAYIEYIRQYA